MTQQQLPARARERPQAPRPIPDSPSLTRPGSVPRDGSQGGSCSPARWRRRARRRTSLTSETEPTGQSCPKNLRVEWRCSGYLSSRRIPHPATSIGPAGNDTRFRGALGACQSEEHSIPPCAQRPLLSPALSRIPLFLVPSPRSRGSSISPEGGGRQRLARLDRSSAPRIKGAW